MRKGSRHNWAYRGRWFERKIAPGKWRFSFMATKRQKAHPGVKRGSRFIWKINGVQRAVKTKSGRYQTKFTGTKKLIKAKVKK